MSNIAVIILTFNEERHVKRAINSVCEVCSEVIVVDSGSNDRTVEIAKANGAKVFINKWTNYANQFQWALDNTKVSSEWILRLDADEYVSRDLIDEIRLRLPRIGADVSGITVSLRYIFMGRKIKYGGRKLELLRLFRNRKARIESRWMDEHIVLLDGQLSQFQGSIYDSNEKGLNFFIEKHNHYSTREAVDILNKKYGLFSFDKLIKSGASSNQAIVKRFIKEKIYNEMPFWIGPLMYFLFRYVLMLGFLDGRRGLIYHFLQGYWYRFLVGAKVYEFDRELKPLSSSQERCERLEQLTGYKFS
ncbi:glycosyltransferase family 2 protein [Prosthecomicrobium hirschii]|uniref:glycosyltransferase family 2 protein n=1 Tax=Prosthecodimorpha hirschii TaxID=665126 RepID=UPI00112E7B88|nr:glycosyltransferase family 2 protein [Prosthecomicrobium hirschii]TPQ49335.1 glycosyltransferase family 2 protein [Prosthecomicrobium hirschii]